MSKKGKRKNRYTKAGRAEHTKSVQKTHEKQDRDKAEKAIKDKKRWNLLWSNPETKRLEEAC